MIAALVLAAIAFPLLLALAARSPSTLLALIIPAEVLVGGMERGAWVPGFRVGEILLAVCLLLLVASPAWQARRLRQHLLNRWMWTLLFGGLVIPLVSWRIRGNAINGEALQAYAWAGRAFALYVTVVPLKLSEEDIGKVLLAAFWAVVASAFVAILQVLNFQPVESLLLAYFKGPHLYERLSGLSNRATGLAANWHSLGIQFVMALVVGWQLATRGEKRPRGLTMGMAVLVLGLWTVRTLTSAFLVCALVGLLLWRRTGVSKTRRWAVRVAIAGIVVAAIVAIVSATSKTRGAAFVTLIPATLYVRAYYWVFLYLPVIRQHLVFGYGPIMPVVNAQSDDSQVILFLLRGGLVGLGSWAVVMWRIMRAGRLAAQHQGPSRSLGEIVSVFTTALCLASVMQSFFTYTGVVEFYWVVVGLLGSQEWAGVASWRAAFVAGPPAVKEEPLTGEV